MIEPLPLASMPGRNALMVRCIDLTLRSKEKSQSFSLQSSTVPWCTKPAALNSTSTGPYFLAMAWMAAVSRASSAAHSATPSSFRPASRASLRSVAMTLAPSRASAIAVARPMPAPAAVQNATFPSTRLGMRLSPQRPMCCAAMDGADSAQLNVSGGWGQADPMRDRICHSRQASCRRHASSMRRAERESSQDRRPVPLDSRSCASAGRE